jgi:hypothetical protein
MTTPGQRARQHLEAEAYQRHLAKERAKLSAIPNKDPDLALRQIRALCDQAAEPQDYDALIHWVRYLDVHLSEGGHRPQEWA